MTDLAVRPDPGRALDVGARLDHGAGADEDLLADDGLADQRAVIARLEVLLEIFSDEGEDFPRLRDAVENRGVVGLLEIEEVGGRKNGNAHDGLGFVSLLHGRARGER